MIQKSTLIKVNGKEYEISYPNVGQKLEIENLKLVYSLGSYSELQKNDNKASIEMLNVIDACAYFKVLSNPLAELFQIKTFDQIEFETSVKMRKAFTQYGKFFMEYEKAMYDAMDKDEEEIEKSEDDIKEDQTA